MEDVRIVFTASATTFGKLIRRITRSSVSHVFLEIPIWGRRFALESTITGVRIIPAEKARKHVVAEYRIKIDTKPALLKVVNLLGSPYDWAGTFLLGLWIIIKDWFKIKSKRPWFSTKTTKCSELIAIYLTFCGIKIWQTALDFVTPDDILKFVTVDDRFEKA